MVKASVPRSAFFDSWKRIKLVLLLLSSLSAKNLGEQKKVTGCFFCKPDFSKIRAISQSSALVAHIRSIDHISKANTCSDMTLPKYN